jgi:hypothetical protein
MNELQKNMFIGHDRHTKLLIHGNGENGSTNIIDSATYKAITLGGSVQISTAQAVLTSSSILFNGTTDYLRIADSDDFYFSNKDFTIGMRVYINVHKTNNFIYCHRYSSSANGSMFIYVDSGGVVRVNIFLDGTSTTFVYGTISAQEWHDIKLVKMNGFLILFIDGVGTTKNIYGTMNNSTIEVYIGCSYSSTVRGNFFDGYMKEIIVSKGVATKTSNFTPSNHEHYI